MIKPRPRQQEVLAYTGGTMGVTAVPGAGKTWTLSLLAANLIAKHRLQEDQELLVVTLVNAAVDHFKHRITTFLDQSGLFPNFGFHVCTLHSLAHEIVRTRPELVGLGEDFQIVDERTAEQIRMEATRSWLKLHGDRLDAYLSATLTSAKRRYVKRDDLPNYVAVLAGNAIRHAKNHGLSPEDLERRLEEAADPGPLARMCADVYAACQRALRYQGSVDFDDLIRHAHRILQLDDDLVGRLRYRWPFVLEDEAQDSSLQQERILCLIAGERGNWVRVGDPNQAIYESFTTADPELLRTFKRLADFPKDLPNSGRSQPGIIRLANTLIRWTISEHPLEAVRTALSEPLIEPAPPDDAQPNPPEDLDRIALRLTPWTEEEEISRVVDSLMRWLAGHPDHTAAVLVPIHALAGRVAAALRNRGLPVNDALLRLSHRTRATAGALTRIFLMLLDPLKPNRVRNVFLVWWQYVCKRDVTEPDAVAAGDFLKACTSVESVLWPAAGDDALAHSSGTLSEAALEAIRAFRDHVRPWFDLAKIPMDQAVLYLASELFDETHRVAVAHKLASVLRQASRNNPRWRFPELVGELTVVAKDERRFAGLSEDDLGFNPDDHPGEVVVTTLHSAKGLEWDRVHLMAVNDYHFPAGIEGDRYLPEKWYVRDSLNLDAEARRQMDAVLENTAKAEGAATREARAEYARERLRLLYVGITRARRELIITTNIGKLGRNNPAVALRALAETWHR